MNFLGNRAFFSPFTSAKLFLGFYLCLSAGCSTAATNQYASTALTVTTSDEEETTADAVDDSDTDGEDQTSADTGTSTSEDSDGEVPSEGAEPFELFSDDPLDQCNLSGSTQISLRPHSANKMTSPVQTRSAIKEGNFGALIDMPIHSWEFLNYYSSYEPPDDDEEKKLSLSGEIYQPVGDSDSTYHLQIRMQAQQVEHDEVAPLHLIFTLDTSNSMQGEPLEMLKQSSVEIINNLRLGDVVSIVNWDESSPPLIENHKINQDSFDYLEKIIYGIEAQGGADLHYGLNKGFQLLKQTEYPNHFSRLVLISDGGPSAKDSELELIKQQMSKKSYTGFSTLGIGVGDYSTYNSELMDSIASVSDGVSLFLSTPEDIERAFDANFVRMFDIAVHKISVDLELPPGFQLVDVQGNPLENTSLSSESRHLATNDTLVMHYYIQACAPEGANPNENVNINVYYSDSENVDIQELTMDVPFKANQLISPQFHKNLALLSYANLLKFWRSTWLKDNEELQFALQQTEILLNNAQVLLPKDQDLLEIRSLIDILNATISDPT